MVDQECDLGHKFVPFEEVICWLEIAEVGAGQIQV